MTLLCKCMEWDCTHRHAADLQPTATTIRNMQRRVIE